MMELNEDLVKSIVALIPPTESLSARLLGETLGFFCSCGMLFPNYSYRYDIYFSLPRKASWTRHESNSVAERLRHRVGTRKALGWNPVVRTAYICSH